MTKTKRKSQTPVRSTRMVRALAEKLYATGCEAMANQDQDGYRGHRLRDKCKPLRAAWQAIALHAIQILRPNRELSSGGPADNRQQTEQAARRLLK